MLPGLRPPSLAVQIILPDFTANVTASGRWGPWPAGTVERCSPGLGRPRSRLRSGRLLQPQALPGHRHPSFRHLPPSGLGPLPDKGGGPRPPRDTCSGHLK